MDWGRRRKGEECSKKEEKLKSRPDFENKTCSRNCQKLVAGSMEGGRDAGDECGDLGHDGCSSVLPSYVALGSS